MLSRRSVIFGGIVLCAPAIIRSPGILMPIKTRIDRVFFAGNWYRYAQLGPVIVDTIAREIVAVQPMNTPELTQALISIYSSS